MENGSKIKRLELKITKNKKLLFIFGLIFIVIISLYLYYFKPNNSKFYPSCPFYFLTGLYCPGCGTLRALHSLLQGEILQAMDYNILTVLFLPVFFYRFFLYGFRSFYNKEHLPLSLSSYSIWIILGIIFLFWILRNIPLYPFTILAP